MEEPQKKRSVAKKSTNRPHVIPSSPQHGPPGSGKDALGNIMEKRKEYQASSISSMTMVGQRDMASVLHKRLTITEDLGEKIALLIFALHTTVNRREYCIQYL